MDYLLSIVSADRAMWVVEAPGDDVEGVTELLGPRESPPSTQVEGAHLAIKESVQEPSGTLRHSPRMRTLGRVSSSVGVAMEGCGLASGLSTLRSADLLAFKWGGGGYPVDASGQLERDQLFINDVSKQLVAELRAARQFNPNLVAKPKSSDTKTDLIYKCAFCNYL